MEGEVAGRRLDLDSPGRGRAVPGIVEYSGRIFQPADPVARHPLPSSLARTNSHPQPLRKEFSAPFVFSGSSVLNLFPEKSFNTENTEKEEVHIGIR